MDRVEDIDRDRTGDRLGEGQIQTHKVTEVETEKEVSAILKDDEVCDSEDEGERSPPKLERISEYRQSHHYPPSVSQPQPTLASFSTSSSHPLLAMETSKVRFQPVSVMAQAEMTSTYGHPRLNWPEKARQNNTRLVHTCIEKPFVPSPHT